MRVLVAHPAQQHSYRLATALKKAGFLYKYSTTVYYKKNNLTGLLAKVLKGRFSEKAKGRRCSALDDYEVIQFHEGLGLMKLLALNVDFFSKYYEKIKYYTADRFAHKVANYVLKNKIDVVITYDDSSPILFEELKAKAPNTLRIIDMSAANLLYMRTIYDSDVKIATSFSDKLKSERKLVWNAFNINRTKRELEATEAYIVPSTFVVKTLEFSGISLNDMYVCPYGVDISQFKLKKFEKIENRPIKFSYVGGVKELKGIYYLLEAFLRIPEDKATLTIVGSYDINASYLKKYIDRVDFTGVVAHKDIPSILQSSDVFILPSLGEGLSLSTLEAAATGLPLIVSENSGVNDHVKDGINGFVIPIQSIEAIEEKVNWFVENPGKIYEMGMNARKMAEQFTWERYNNNIAEIFNEIKQERMKRN